MTLHAGEGRKVLSVVPRQYLPYLTGGLEITANETCSTIVDIGWNVIVAARSPVSERVALMDRIVRRAMGPYHRTEVVGKSGYRCFTDIWHPTKLEELVAREKPQLVVCHVSHNDDVVSKVSDIDLPTLFYVHSDQYSVALKESARKMRKCLFAAESEFIAMLTAGMTGRRVIKLPPLIDPHKYRVDSTGDDILVINPNYQKGGDLIVEIADRLRHRHFVVAGGWSSAADDSSQLQIETALSTLPNVERIKHMADVRGLFSRARMLLMPCRVAEAFGRAAAESQIAGIPVLASDRGALPETVGNGGKCVPFESPPEEWVAEIERLFLDEAHFRNLSGRALENAAQLSRQPHYFCQQLQLHLEELCST